MPLRARLGEQSLISTELLPAAFDALRGERGLRMACCDSLAVPKRSRLGLPFFAHARRGACDYAQETELHLQAKLCLLEGALTAGWDAQLEVTGQGGDGSSWRADVLCVHPSTGERVALEFQRSAQTAAQMQARQEQYRSGGVRGWWFVVSPHLSGTRPWQAGTPALRVTPELTVPELGASLSEAATLALTGGLTLLPSALFPLTLTVLARTERCGACLTLFATLTAFGLHHRDASGVRVTEWTAARLAWCREVLGSAWPLDTELLLRPGSGRDGACPACGAAHRFTRLKWEPQRWWEELLPGEEQAGGLPTHSGLDWRFTRRVHLSAAQAAWLAQGVGSQWVRR